jgi:hypothetical protein
LQHLSTCQGNIKKMLALNFFFLKLKCWLILQDISIEVILALPRALNRRLKGSMLKIEVLLHEAQSIIPLAELVEKSKKRETIQKDVFFQR